MIIFNTLNNIKLAVILSFLVCYTNAQELSTKHFDGYEDWPIYKPGDLKFKNNDISDLRIGFVADEMGGPGGPNLKLYLDFINVIWKGKPANWIQWTFSDSNIESKGTPSLDLLIVDKETQGLIFRLHPNGRPNKDQWTRPYGYIHAMPDKIRQMTIKDDGTASLDILKTTPVYEFAALGFMFPFLELEVGKKFQLKRHHFPSKTIPPLAVNIIGKDIIIDKNKRQHSVWKIETMGPSKTSIVTYYVSKSAPYFFGWDYKRVKDGVSLFKMKYEDWIPAKI